MKIGITGYRGFIGSFFKNYLEHFTDYEPIGKEPSDDFSDVKIVVHFAEKNKGDDKEVYMSNRNSCHDLISSLKVDVNELTDKSNIKLIYASSIHQNDMDLYGLYRRQNINDFEINIEDVTVVQVPNVFGPFCKPNYNSFMATFCDRIIKEEKIDVVDKEVILIYVEDLCIKISNIIDEKVSGDVKLPWLGDNNGPKSIITTVQSVYDRLLYFKNMYLDKLIIPRIDDEFDLNLFNTFRSYLKDDQKVFEVKNVVDDRGRLSELLKSENKGQVFFSTTKPDIVRGNHFHRKRIERFCVLKGKALIEIRRVGDDKVIKYEIDGHDYKVIDMPIYYTHSLKNIGKDELVCVFWMNDILDENVTDDSKYLMVN